MGIKFKMFSSKKKTGDRGRNENTNVFKEE